MAISDFEFRSTFKEVTVDTLCVFVAFRLCHKDDYVGIPGGLITEYWGRAPNIPLYLPWNPPCSTARQTTLTIFSWIRLP